MNARRTCVTMVLGAALAWPGATGGAHAATASDTFVAVGTQAWDPARVSVAASVTWRNPTAFTHTVQCLKESSSPCPWSDAAPLPPGGSVTMQFRDPGVYEFRCSIHPNMTGEIYVGAPSLPTATGPTGPASPIPPQPGATTPPVPPGPSAAHPPTLPATSHPGPATPKRPGASHPRRRRHAHPRHHRARRGHRR